MIDHEDCQSRLVGHPTVWLSSTYLGQTRRLSRVFPQVARGDRPATGSVPRGTAPASAGRVFVLRFVFPQPILGAFPYFDASNPV